MPKQFTLVGRYEWVKEIGEGGFGAVELYRDLVSQENVAIKTIPAMFVNQESKRLVREVDIMRFLHTAHPHVIGCFSMFATASVKSSDKKSWHDSVAPTPPELDLTSPVYQNLRPFEKLSVHHQAVLSSVEKLRSSSEFNVHMVMPLMSGDLFYFIKLIANPARAKVAITPDYLGTVAGIYAFQICFGLDFLHQSGIVHRDMKPDNVLVKLDTKLPFMSCAVIADLGLARDTGDSETFYVCTRYYRPPDVVMGFSRGASATDVWSLGCIFYELCTCQTLFTMGSALNDRGTWDGYYASQQLEVILNIMGCPTPEEVDRFAPKSSNAKSYLMRSPPRASQLEALLRKNWKLGVDEHRRQLWIDLIKSCLRFFPQQRPTAEQLCHHPLFEEIGMIYGENVCQVAPNIYRPFYNEKQMSNQNRAENKHITLGLLVRALQDAVPDHDADAEEDDDKDDGAAGQKSRAKGKDRANKDGDDEEDEEDEEEDEEDFQQAVSQFASQFGGLSAYRVQRGSAARVDRADNEEDGGDVAGVAPSIYQAAGPRTEPTTLLDKDSRAGSTLLNQNMMPSMFDQRNAGRAVVENEESDLEDEMVGSSSSDSDDAAPGGRGAGSYMYPSSFLRPLQDPPQPPPPQPTSLDRQSSPYAPEESATDGLAQSGAGKGSFLGNYVAPSMFRAAETNGSGSRKKDSADTEGLEPATLLRRTYTGSGNVQAPYNYLNSMRVPSTATLTEESKQKARAAGVSLLPAVKGVSPSSQNLTRVNSDLQYPYPILMDAYRSVKRPSASSPSKSAAEATHHPTAQAAASAPRAAPLTGGAPRSPSKSAAESPRRRAKNGAAPVPATHAGNRPRKPEKTDGAGSRRGSRNNQSASGTQPPLKLNNETSGWAIKAPEFQTATVPGTKSATDAHATTQKPAHTTKKTDLAPEEGAYSYFDGVVLNTYVDGRSLVQTAPPASQGNKSTGSNNNVHGNSQSRFGASLSGSAQPGYSFLQSRVSEETGEMGGGSSRERSRSRMDESDGFPSLSDKSLEERYRGFTHSDSGMQKGLTAVLAELNQSTDDPEKTRQLREVMNYFGTQRQSRK